MRKASKNVEDHLGSVTYKVADMLDDLVRVVLGTELWVTGIKQVFFGAIILSAVKDHNEYGLNSQLLYRLQLHLAPFWLFLYHLKESQ